MCIKYFRMSSNPKAAVRFLEDMREAAYEICAPEVPKIPIDKNPLRFLLVDDKGEHTFPRPQDPIDQE